MQYVMKGGIPLTGEVTISGAKNAALGLLCAAIMTDETVVIDNLPDVKDINRLLDALCEIGAQVKRIDRHTVEICGKTVRTVRADSDNIKKIRASYYLMGALLGKYKRAEIALPGGCDIGSRPIDQHLKGFRALNASADIEFGMAVASSEHLAGGHIYLDVVSVGATINIILAAALADGVTILENAAKEPHVVDVANFLNSCGAKISGAGTDTIKIRGVEKLHGCTYAIIPDMIEAGSFMAAAVATHGSVQVNNVIPKHLESISAKLEETGATIEEFDDAVLVTAGKQIRKTSVKTMPYPGFPTDMHPQMSALLCCAEGTSYINESIFENRFRYVEELRRMGAKIKVDGRIVVIEGGAPMKPASVIATDLRGGVAVLIAALATEGTTEITEIRLIERGYDNICEKLRELGADIRKVTCPDNAE